MVILFMKHDLFITNYTISNAKRNIIGNTIVAICSNILQILAYKTLSLENL